MRAAGVGFACTLILASTTAAQQIRGVVLEDGSRRPIAAATVEAQDAAGNRSARTATDSLGRFALTLPSAGEWSVAVDHIAYANVTGRAVAVAPGEQVELVILLAVGVIPLDPVLVRSRVQPPLGRLREFYDRATRAARGGEGRFITRADLERSPGILVTDHLAMIPGVFVRPRGPDNVALMRGAGGFCRPAVFLDGGEIGAGFAAMIDQVASPETLEGVEVYRSPLQTPIRYRKGGCGAILLWSRSGQNAGAFSWRRLLVGAGLLVGIVLFARGM